MQLILLFSIDEVTSVEAKRAFKQVEITDVR